MFKYIKQFILFLLPIVKQTTIQVAADELAKMAYPSRPKVGYRRYTQRGTGHYTDLPIEKKTQDALNYEEARTAGKYHDVVMVAFDIAGPNALLVQAILEDLMPTPGNHSDGVGIDAWWIADDIIGNSDCDSAVFVTKGKQEEARQLLRAHGLVD